jgi:prophage antirepressor-like protein
MKQRGASSLPVLAEQRGDIKVYDLRGELCMSQEDLGKALGFADPVNSMNAIYQRHKEELDEWRFSYQSDTKNQSDFSVQSVPKNTRGRPRIFYWEEGIYLVCMFAQTPIAREVRASIARIMKRLRMQGRLHLLERIVELQDELDLALAKRANKRWSEEEKAAVKTLHSQGMSGRRIAKELGRARPAVSNLINYGNTSGRKMLDTGDKSGE